MLVNSAGNQIKAPSLEFTPENWASVMGVHLDGTLFWSQAAARNMLRNGGGAIVNLASVSMYFALPRRPAYACAKAAVGALTRTLAVEWAEYGIRVNAVAPGFFASEMTAGLGEDADSFPDWLTEQIPLGRGGRAGELDQSILYLLGAGSSFVTGQVLTVDGGMATR
jgi:NAD(P)-dependent dehydrogenase (short-subunit alcohol dehydrogenase family)